MRKSFIVAVCLLPAVIVAALIFTKWRSAVVPPGNPQPIVQRRTDYITSAGCRECHSEEYESWHDSYHRTMTQTANAESVVAPIDDITVHSRGRSYRFYRKDGQFRVQMVDPDWEWQRQFRGLLLEGIDHLPVIDRQIVMTTGSHHYQIYWIEGRNGNERLLIPFVYHIATKQWIPREDVFLQPSSKRQFVLWNGNCIICHTVGGRPGFDTERLVHNSKFVELGIACEACHGPGGRHAEAHKRGEMSTTRSDSNDYDPLIVNPARLDTRRSAAVCGQCHGDFYPQNAVAWIKNGYADSFRPGELLDESRVIVRYSKIRKRAGKTGQRVDPRESSFWNDGTHRVGGREYNGLIESGCYQKGKMTCLSCHSMHNYREPDDQLSVAHKGNASCLQCHEDFADRISQHTHHKPGSSGSLCYNCHMPHTTYALFKAIRSHRIDSPNSESFSKSDRPNACNLCHLDQTMQWTVDTLHKWYGQPKITLDNEKQTVAASILWLLKGDAAQRAVTVWSAGWKPAKEASRDDWTTPYVAELLTDPYAVVRFMAARTLKTSNAQLDSSYNFVGPATEWKLQRKRVIEAWKNTHRKQQPDRRQRLLLDLKGLPIRREVERLLRLRNNKRIFIAE